MSSGEKKFNGWLLELGKVEYQRVLDWQRNLVKLRKDGMARDTLIIVEHPPVLTIGKDGHPENFKKSKLKPISIERGGDVTYHGPGQLVVYFICNLTRRKKDMHLYIDKLQDGIIGAFKEYGVDARKDDTNTGVWVGDKKIVGGFVAVRRNKRTREFLESWDKTMRKGKYFYNKDQPALAKTVRNYYKKLDFLVLTRQYVDQTSNPGSYVWSSHKVMKYGSKKVKRSQYNTKLKKMSKR